MNRQLLFAVVAGLVIGSCISAKAAEPSTNIKTDSPFAGKIVRVHMAGDEIFVLENVTLTDLYNELYLVGTGIKNGPDWTSRYEGLKVYLNRHLVASCCPMTPDQWKTYNNPLSAPPRRSPGGLGSDTTPTVATPSVGSPPITSPPITSPPITSPPITSPPITSPPITSPRVATPPVASTPATLIASPEGIVPIMPPATGINAAQLKAIQDERIKLLTQVVEILTSQYKVATVDYPQVASAESDLCNALLDSTDEPEKRVALLTKQLDKANEVVKLMQGRFDAGTVSEVDVDRAKVLCLDIKTKLLRERSKERPMTITPTTKRP